MERNEEQITDINHLPDVLLIQILSYLPQKCYLPIAHVSKNFRSNWIEMKRLELLSSSSSSKKGKKKNASYGKETDPHEIGNLFHSSWSSLTNSNSTNKNNRSLNTQLLQYYLNNGWAGGSFDSNQTATDKTSKEITDTKQQQQDEDSNNDNDDDQKSKKVQKMASIFLDHTIMKERKKVMLSAASCGDIYGLQYLIQNDIFPCLDDDETCTMAAAAGQLTTVRWLRGENVETLFGDDDDEDDDTTNVISKVPYPCVWNPTEVHKEASENLHEDVMTYVEKNCGKHEIQMHYGVGLPW